MSSLRFLLTSVTLVATSLTVLACAGEAPDLMEPGDDPTDPEFEDERDVVPIADEAYQDTLDILPDMPAAGGRLRVCGAAELNQRSGPGTSYPVLRAIPEDEELTVIDRSGNWVQGAWLGQVGWSHGRYLCAITDGPPAMSASESIERPGSGRLRAAVRVGPHPRYVVADTGRAASYGTAETVYWIGRAFDQVALRHPAASRPQVRDLSVRAGGRPAGSWPHSSHQSGRDVDLTYPRPGCPDASGCPLAAVSPTTFDVATTWTLLEVWLTNRVARRIFIDASLHPALRAEARRRGHGTAQLDRWFGPIIMHVANHLNHLHVRFECPPDDGACRN